MLQASGRAIVALQFALLLLNPSTVYGHFFEILSRILWCDVFNRAAVDGTITIVSSQR